MSITERPAEELEYIRSAYELTEWLGKKWPRKITPTDPTRPGPDQVYVTGSRNTPQIGTFQDIGQSMTAYGTKTAYVTAENGYVVDGPLAWSDPKHVFQNFTGAMPVEGGWVWGETVPDGGLLVKGGVGVASSHPELEQISRGRFCEYIYDRPIIPISHLSYRLLPRFDDTTAVLGKKLAAVKELQRVRYVHHGLMNEFVKREYWQSLEPESLPKFDRFSYFNISLAVDIVATHLYENMPEADVPEDLAKKMTGHARKGEAIRLEVETEARTWTAHHPLAAVGSAKEALPETLRAMFPGYEISVIGRARTSLTFAGVQL